MSTMNAPNMAQLGDHDPKAPLSFNQDWLNERTKRT